MRCGCATDGCVRNYPPGSVADSFMFLNGENGLPLEDRVDQLFDVNKKHFFEDDEILETDCPDFTKGNSSAENDVDFLGAVRTKSHHWLIGQVSLKNSREACIHMLSLDALQAKGMPIDRRGYYTSNSSGTDESTRGKLQRYGFQVLTFELPKENAITQLKNRCVTSGPTMLTLKDDLISSHSVVVNKVFEDDSVQLSDPFHKWEIRVPKEAFLKRLVNYNLCFQIAENAPNVST